MENKKITSNFIEKENSNYKWKDKVKLRELTEIPQENKVMAEDLNYLNKKPDKIKEEVSGEIKNVNDRVSNLVNIDFKKVLDELKETKKQVRDLREIINNLKPTGEVKDVTRLIDKNGKFVELNVDEFQLNKNYSDMYFKFYRYQIEYSPIIFHWDLNRSDFNINLMVPVTVFDKALYDVINVWFKIDRENSQKIIIGGGKWYRISFDNGKIIKEDIGYDKYEYQIKYVAF